MVAGTAQPDLFTGDYGLLVLLLQASYWSNKKHEVQGTIRSLSSGDVHMYLFGKWTESLICKAGHEKTTTNRCIWRAGLYKY